jgi:hypothetical protein
VVQRFPTIFAALVKNPPQKKKKKTKKKKKNLSPKAENIGTDIENEEPLMFAADKDNKV